MLESVLIANRGEIACRIIKTARRLGMRTVAVYSQADAQALFVRQADEAYPIGPPPAAESYLRIDTIIEVARQAGAASIHPGYGFLSERAEFAEACAANGIVFVGPPPAAIRAMGLKDAAKALAERAGVPVVPGYHGERQQPDFLRRQAEEIGYPVLIKAVAGGGGKGMRRVDEADEFDAALASAQREAQASFGNAQVLVEKYILSPRHIEMQVFADTHGNVVHLFERDCSLQRRHQKVIEEAPAPGMTAAMREAMGRAATEAARAVGYAGAGTVEFIADGREGLRPDRFYFMEMNTRLQVEHPVTEAVTGLDLVELQFRVAAGEALPFTQADLALDGHAVEARLYAEDPEKGFLPSTGRLRALDFPAGEGIRVDTGVEAGAEVTPFYDPMIAKVIAHAPTRPAALAKLAEALGRTLVAGPKTNLAFLKRLCEAPEFVAGAFDTGFIDRNAEELGAVPRSPDPVAIASGALYLAGELADRIARQGNGVLTPANRHWSDPWRELRGFGLLGEMAAGFPVLADGERLDAHLSIAQGQLCLRLGDGTSRSRADIRVPGGARATPPFDRAEFADATFVIRDGDNALVLRDGRQTSVAAYDPFAIDIEHLDDAGGLVKSPMHGKLVALLVKTGDVVAKGQRVAIVEAMKMEHALVAPQDGIVAETIGEPGQQVGEGARIVVITGQGD